MFQKLLKEDFWILQVVSQTVHHSTNVIYFPDRVYSQINQQSNQMKERNKKKGKRWDFFFIFLYPLHIVRLIILALPLSGSFVLHTFYMAV